jgi:hypothetical protein
MSDNATEPAPTFTTHWGIPSTSVANEGDYGYFPAIDMHRASDNAPFHLHVYEDGNGGLIVHVYAPDVAVVITTEHDPTATTQVTVTDA